MIYSTGTFPPLRKSSLLLTTAGKGEKIPRKLQDNLHFMMFRPAEQDHKYWTGYKHMYLVEDLCTRTMRKALIAGAREYAETGTISFPFPYFTVNGEQGGIDWEWDLISNRLRVVATLRGYSMCYTFTVQELESWKNSTS